MRPDFPSRKDKIVAALEHQIRAMYRKWKTAERVMVMDMLEKWIQNR
ncbi:MAG: hypothetical protein II748_05805 [Clostridia bacterium]|nr:hypothetical protein [Clostridia bacterium]